MILRRCGAGALLVELPSPAARAALDKALQEAPFDLEAVPGELTLLVRAADETELPAIARWLIDCQPGELSAADGVLHTIPVRYDGPDLAEVATTLNVEVEALIERHTGQVWRVEFLGFMPGFGYLTGDDSLTVSRRATPRTKIAPGSVGLAGRYCGIYPHASPGGWQLIGHSDVQLFDAAAVPPTLWQPGDRVQFVLASDA